MDNLQLLARLAARVWYTDKQVVLVDLLSQHPTLKEDELAFQTKLNLNQLRKVIGRLRSDRFVQIEYRPEPRKWDGKIVQRIYYYIDYKSLYDCIKFKLFKIQRFYQQRSHKEKVERGYVCPQCKQRFDAVDVMFYRHGSNQLFRCPNHLQDFFLTLEEEQESESYTKLTKFMQAVEPIIALLKRVEGTKVSVYKPGQTVVDESGETVQAAKARKEKILKLQQEEEEEQRVVVEIQTNQSEVTSLTAEAELEKERIRKQNELPFWHQRSTIVEQTTMTASAEPVVSTDQSPTESIIAEQEEEAVDDIMDYYNQYYANYAASKAAEEQQKEERVGLVGDFDEEQDEEFMEVKAPAESDPHLNSNSGADIMAEVDAALDEEDEEFIEVK